MTGAGCPRGGQGRLAFSEKAQKRLERYIKCISQQARPSRFVRSARHYLSEKLGVVRRYGAFRDVIVHCMSAKTFHTFTARMIVFGQAPIRAFRKRSPRAACCPMRLDCFWVGVTCPIATDIRVGHRVGFMAPPGTSFFFNSSL